MGFGQSADIDIVFDDIESRKSAEVKTEDGKKEKYLLYYDGETVSGKVSIWFLDWIRFNSPVKIKYFNLCEWILDVNSNQISSLFSHAGECDIKKAG